MLESICVGTGSALQSTVHKCIHDGILDMLKLSQRKDKSSIQRIFRCLFYVQLLQIHVQTYQLLLIFFFCRCCVYTLPHSVILHVCVCGGEKDLSIDVSFICRCVSTYVCLYMHATPKRVDKCGRNMEPLVARRSVGRYSVWYILLHRMPICFYVPTIY